MPTYICRLALLCTAFFLTEDFARGQGSSVWSRGVLAEPSAGSSSFADFSLATVHEDNGELDGTWLYTNHGSSAIEFKATRDALGFLWPDVKMEVKEDASSRWIVVNDSCPSGQRITVKVNPGEYVELFVPLNSLRSYVGKNESARVTLTTGQTSQFELKYLVPPRGN